MKVSTKELTLIAFFAALTAAGAFIRIPLPFYPVPFTLQTFLVMLCGLLLPRRAALLSQAVYVCLGLAGLPVFTAGGGLSYVFHQSFGYLISFLFAAPLCGFLASLRPGGKWTVALACFGASLFINVCGVLYMTMLGSLFSGSPVSLDRAVYLLTVFLPFDACKSILCAFLAPAIVKRLPAGFAR